ncbi:MAG: WYL domain-containing protein [Xanthomonadales bacterium]|nr:WYL domain-containing protein [Xanthomonadales bacterium]
MPQTRRRSQRARTDAATGHAADTGQRAQRAARPADSVGTAWLSHRERWAEPRALDLACAGRRHQPAGHRSRHRLGPDHAAETREEPVAARRPASAGAQVCRRRKSPGPPHRQRQNPLGRPHRRYPPRTSTDSATYCPGSARSGLHRTRHQYTSPRALPQSLRRRTQTIPTAPASLVVREGVIYLIATARDYTEPRQFALHRMQKAKLLDTPARRLPDFDLETYIREGGMALDVGEEIKLELDLAEGAGYHLTEQKLSPDQTCVRMQAKQGEVFYRVTATVRESMQLKWWLNALGDEVLCRRVDGHDDA